MMKIIVLLCVMAVSLAERTSVLKEKFGNFIRHVSGKRASARKAKKAWRELRRDVEPECFDFEVLGTCIDMFFNDDGCSLVGDDIPDDLAECLDCPGIRIVFREMCPEGAQSVIGEIEPECFDDGVSDICMSIFEDVGGCARLENRKVPRAFKECLDCTNITDEIQLICAVDDEEHNENPGVEPECFKPEVEAICMETFMNSGGCAVFEDGIPEDLAECFGCPNVEDKLRQLCLDLDEEHDENPDVEPECFTPEVEGICLDMFMNSGGCAVFEDGIPEDLAECFGCPNVEDKLRQLCLDLGAGFGGGSGAVIGGADQLKRFASAVGGDTAEMLRTLQPTLEPMENSGMNGEEYCESPDMIRNAEACKASSCCHWNTWEAGHASFNGKGRCWSSIGQDTCEERRRFNPFQNAINIASNIGPVRDTRRDTVQNLQDLINVGSNLGRDTQRSRDQERKAQALRSIGAGLTASSSSGRRRINIQEIIANARKAAKKAQERKGLDQANLASSIAKKITSQSLRSAGRR